MFNLPPYNHGYCDYPQPGYPLPGFLPPPNRYPTYVGESSNGCQQPCPPIAAPPNLLELYDGTHKPSHSVYRLKLSEYSREAPGCANEVYCVGFPYNLSDLEILTEFSKNGRVFELRIPRDRGGKYKQKGFAFGRFLTNRDACAAVANMSGYKFSPNRELKASLSLPDRGTSFVVGNIPRSKSYEVLWREFCRRTDGLADLIIIPDAFQPERFPNQGSCILTYDTHANSIVAQYKIANDYYPYWGQTLIIQRGTEDELISLISKPCKYVSTWTPEPATFVPRFQCRGLAPMAQPQKAYPANPGASSGGGGDSAEPKACTSSAATVEENPVAEMVPELPDVVYPRESDLESFGLTHLFGELYAD